MRKGADPGVKAWIQIFYPRKKCKAHDESDDR